MANRFSEWRDRSSLPATFAFLFVVFTAGQLLISGFWSRGNWVPAAIGYGIGGVVYAAMLTGIIAWRRRRSGGADTTAAINRACRTGHAPAEVDAAIWLPELARRVSNLERDRILGPVVFGCFAAVGVVLVVLGESVWVSLGLTIFFVAFGVYYWFARRRILTRTASVLEQVDTRTPVEPHPTY
ncbi:hypothetical protein [Frondihabitans cladoniiphilus]|uniref:hypothetical protein n=1 Tax=Frondihabitans cladoniiphilus TaxID=715785 RepID=UPI0031EDEDB8